jgi:hypothetical protein
VASAVDMVDLLTEIQTAEFREAFNEFDKVHKVYNS